MKRIGLFLLTNIAVMVTVSLVLNLLGVRGYISAEYGIDYSSLMIFCLVWGMAGSFISLLISKWMAKKMMGVQIVDENSQYGDLVRSVKRLAISAGINTAPEVGVYESAEINAFATGASKNNSLVAVSTGLLNSMDNDEIEGVLAHEIAHIANGDMVTLALIQGIVNAFVMFFARIAAFAVQNAMRGDNDRDSSPVGGGFAYIITVFVFEIIFGILASTIVAFFSRYREYKADSGGAKLAGRDKMIKALQSLQKQFDVIPEEKDSGVAAMKISSKSSGFRALFSTHPPLEDRIKALQRG